MAQAPRLLVALVEPNEPGNLGAVIRTADAAGADAVVVDGGADPYGGKAVRASAGSLFHLPVVAAPAQTLLTGASGRARPSPRAGTATSTCSTSRTADRLRRADGLAVRVRGPRAAGYVLAAVDQRVRIPIPAAAESLNLAAAAAVCLYARPARNPLLTPTGE